MPSDISKPAPMLSKHDRGTTGIGSKDKLIVQSNLNHSEKKIMKKTVQIASQDSHRSNDEVKRRAYGDKRHWKKDNSTNSCFNCHSKFGIYMRKHHCRKCGEIICDSCSTFVEVTKNDFDFDSTTQKSLIRSKERFCCKCTRERGGDKMAKMAKAYSQTKKSGFLGFGVVPKVAERVSNVDGISVDNTEEIVESIMNTPVMAFLNRDTSGNQPPMYVGHLKIIVKSAENLSPADLNGKADPYVKIYLKGKTSFGEDWDPKRFSSNIDDIKGKTSVKNVTLFPVWNEQINFKIPRADAYLQVEVWDRDVFNKNEMMASTIIELEDLMAESASSGNLIGNALHKQYQLKDKKRKDAGTLDLSLEFHWNLWGYILSRYWPEQKPKVEEPNFSANITIKNIKDLLSELQPYIDFVVNFVNLMAWNNSARSAMWISILLFVTYYPRFMFPLVNFLLLRKIYLHYKARLQRIVSIKQNSPPSGKPQKKKNRKKIRKVLGRIFPVSEYHLNVNDEEDLKEHSIKNKDENPQESSHTIEEQDLKRDLNDTTEEGKEENTDNALGLVLNTFVGLFGNDTLKSIQNYIGLVVRILRIIRHLWDWNSPIVTIVMAVIMGLSLLFHATILNFKYTWMTLIVFLFIVLTPIWDYGLFGVLRTVTNIGTYLKVKDMKCKKSTDSYREGDEDEDENEYEGPGEEHSKE